VIRRKPPDLDRFLTAQRGTYEQVLDELRLGRKTGHWIWYIFPQLAGLGRSDVSRFFAIASLDEARDFLADETLGTRLRECAALVLAIRDRSARDILGDIDAVKLRSSMTLFQRAAPDDPLFRQVLVRYYDGIADAATDALLDGDRPRTEG
jgi:uncharacterized protein (DUF1810 family)